MAVYKKRHLPVSSLYGKAIGLEPVPRTLPFLGSTPFSFRRVWALRRLTSDALLKSKLQLKSEEIYLDSSSSSFTFLTVDGMAVEGLHPCVAFVVCKVTAFEISLWFASESNINNERSELSLRHWLTAAKWWWFCHLLLLLLLSLLLLLFLLSPWASDSVEAVVVVSSAKLSLFLVVRGREQSKRHAYFFRPFPLITQLKKRGKWIMKSAGFCCANIY